jgi:hypothetical protein
MTEVNGCYSYSLLFFHRVVKRDEPRRNIFACIGHKALWVTVINIKSAKNLKKVGGKYLKFCSII